MKKLFTVLFCFAAIQTFAQTYKTNAKTNDFAAFIADTTAIIFYIENFKQADLKRIGEKSILSNAKICRADYKSSAGDLIFSTRNNEMIFYYHVPDDAIPQKI